MVTLTELAASKVQEIIAERAGGRQLALRVYVQSGGCSGLSYGLGLDEVRDDDAVYEMHGVTVVVDPESAPYLEGSLIDYKEALRGGGFAITNPNAVRTCGCGSSFRTAEHAVAAEPC